MITAKQAHHLTPLIEIYYDPTMGTRTLGMSEPWLVQHSTANHCAHHFWPMARALILSKYQLYHKKWDIIMINHYNHFIKFIDTECNSKLVSATKHNYPPSSKNDPAQGTISWIKPKFTSTPYPLAYFCSTMVYDFQLRQSSDLRLTRSTLRPTFGPTCILLDMCGRARVSIAVPYEILHRTTWY
jgi:hypothetical protein